MVADCSEQWTLERHRKTPWVNEQKRLIVKLIWGIVKALLTVLNGPGVEFKARPTLDHYFLFMYFNWRIITTCWFFFFFFFCHTSAWIGHRYTCVSLILNLPSHILPHPTPLGCSRAWALGALLDRYFLKTWVVAQVIVYCRTSPWEEFAINQKCTIFTLVQN